MLFAEASDEGIKKLGPVHERRNCFIPGINVPYLVIYPWDEAHLSLELSYYTFQEPAPG